MFLNRTLTTTLLALAVLSVHPVTAQAQAPAGTQAGKSARPRTSNCVLVGASHSMTFAVGAHRTNTFVSTVDPDLRKFVIYVPSSYQDDAGPYPVVYMFPGTGQTAQDIQGNTNWSQTAEALDFIVVYPEGLRYLMLDGSIRRKWNTPGLELLADPSEFPLPDDVTFIREVHNTVGSHLNIDCDRIYASGFSNGGGFVKTRIRVDLPDIFAATSSGGGMGVNANAPSDYYPADGVTFRPHFGIVGSQDHHVVDGCIDDGDLGPGDAIPLQVADIVATPCIWDALTNMAATVGMDPLAYSSIEQASFTQLLWGSASLPGPGPTEFRFRVLPGLGHAYPSGNNFPVDYVPLYYLWMSQFTK